MDAQIRDTPFHRIGRFGRGYVRAVTLTARDLDYLQALYTHGMLSTDVLGALVAPEGAQRQTTDRMFLLKHPPNAYIKQPIGQERDRRANCSHLVFEITEKGVTALVDSGRITYEDYDLWSRLGANFKAQHFDHDCAAGHVLASFELGGRNLGLRFISWRDILNRPRCPAQTRDSRNPLAVSYEDNGERRLLIPDGLFGLQYPAGACFFALEIDMATEQHVDNAAKSVTLRQKLRAYRYVMRDRLFVPHFGLPSVLLLMVTPSMVRMRNMMDYVNRICKHDADDVSRSFLFRAEPRIVRPSTDRLPTDGGMMTIPWDRPNYPQLRLSEL